MRWEDREIKEIHWREDTLRLYCQGNIHVYHGVLVSVISCTFPSLFVINYLCWCCHFPTYYGFLAFLTRIFETLENKMLDDGRKDVKRLRWEDREIKDIHYWEDT